jgi:hypothetical protein
MGLQRVWAGLGWLSLVCLVSTLNACETESRESFVDEGPLCFTKSASGGVLVKSYFGSCYSSSCSRAEGLECHVEIEDGRILVSSRGAVTTHGGTCTADCHTYSTDCDVGALEPGEYTVKYGARSATLKIPLMTDAGSGVLALDQDPNGFFPCFQQ